MDKVGVSISLIFRYPQFGSLGRHSISQELILRDYEDLRIEDFSQVVSNLSELK
jgi:hypothetical protein